MKSRKELTESVCTRYRTANRQGKSIILREFCQNAGYNRAYAAMLLRGYRLRRVEAGPTGAIRMRAVKVRRMIATTIRLPSAVWAVWRSRTWYGRTLRQGCRDAQHGGGGETVPEGSCRA